MYIGICQTNIVYEDKKTNLLAAEDYIAYLAGAKAEIVLFPEMSMTGFSMDASSIYEEGHGITENTIKEYAKKYKVAIGYGIVKKREDGFYNCYQVVDKNGALLCEYAKIHPFSYSKEDDFYQKGDEIFYFEINGITFCPFICYDLRFPEIFQAASRKADVITVAANWGGARNTHWRLLLQARALENQAFVVGINRVGEDKTTFYVGNSMVVNPEGEIINELEDKPGCLIANINKKDVEEFRKKFPVKADRRPEIYSKL